MEKSGIIVVLNPYLQIWAMAPKRLFWSKHLLSLQHVIFRFWDDGFINNFIQRIHSLMRIQLIQGSVKMRNLHCRNSLSFTRMNVWLFINFNDSKGVSRYSFSTLPLMNYIFLYLNLNKKFVFTWYAFEYHNCFLHEWISWRSTP